MGRTLKPKGRAKIIHKRLKACGYDVKLFKKRFSPNKSCVSDYNRFIEDVNLYNKFYGYLVCIEL